MDHDNTQGSSPASMTAPEQKHEYLRERVVRGKIAIARLQAVMLKTLTKEREATTEARRLKELAKHIELALVYAEESSLWSALELDKANLTAELDWQAESALALALALDRK